MTDDLTTRLLAAIEERERVVKQAGEARIAWASWTDRGKAKCAPVSDLDGEWIAVDRQVHPTDLQVVWDPGDAILLCQAHREIVEFYLTCRADYALASEKRNAYRGYIPDEMDELEENASTAFARFSVADHMVSIIASAYCLDTPREGK